MADPSWCCAEAVGKGCHEGEAACGKGCTRPRETHNMPIMLEGLLVSGVPQSAETPAEKRKAASFISFEEMWARGDRLGQEATWLGGQAVQLELQGKCCWTVAG